MTMPDREQTWDDEIAIDLLIDGELDDVRRRELLLRLENVPGGWRRCALAFLESQAWRQGSQSMWTEPRLSRNVVAGSQPIETASHRSVFRGTWGSLFAVAASFGVAFALGSWYRTGTQLTNNAGVLGAGTLAQTTQSTNEAATGDSGMLPDGYVTLLMDGVADGESKQLQLPVHMTDGAIDASFVEQPLNLPPELLEQIERSGQTLRHQRQFVPLHLQDGRRMIVPMDEVQIVPVARVFQ